MRARAAEPPSQSPPRMGGEAGSLSPSWGERAEGWGLWGRLEAGGAGAGFGLLQGFVDLVEDGVEVFEDLVVGEVEDFEIL